VNLLNQQGSINSFQGNWHVDERFMEAELKQTHEYPKNNIAKNFKI
jgi:hypothetical protein